MKNNNTNQLNIEESLGLITSGDIEKIPSDDSLFSNHFLQFHNHYIKSDYDKKVDKVKNILNQAPGATRWLKNLSSDTKYEVVFSEETKQKLKEGTATIMESRKHKGRFTAMIREKGVKGIKEQLTLKMTDFSQSQVDNLLSTSQIMNIQQSIQKVSAQIEALDAKLNNVLLGAQYDRLAHIQSAYNMFLQTRVSKNYKDLLFPIIIGQLNLGREQLIYSLRHSLQELSSKKQGPKALWEQMWKDEDILKIQRGKYADFKQSLSFIIRSTQLLAIIYQEMNEKHSMMQSVIRLKEVLESIKNSDKEALMAWSQHSEDGELLLQSIDDTFLAMEYQFNNLISNKQDLKLNIKTT